MDGGTYDDKCGSVLGW